MLEGLQYIADRPVLLMSFVIDLCAMIFAMPRALFPQVAEQRFGGEGAVGWLTAAIAGGAVIAGLASGWIGRVHRQGVALVCAVIAWGIAVAASGLAHALWLALLFLAVAGAADLVSAVYRQTILQVYAPDEMRGRLQGVFTVVVAGGPRLGDLRAGVMAATTSVTWAWVGGGIACVIAVVLLAIAVPATAAVPDRSGHARARRRRGTRRAKPAISELGIEDTSTPAGQPSPPPDRGAADPAGQVGPPVHVVPVLVPSRSALVVAVARGRWSRSGRSRTPARISCRRSVHMRVELGVR